MIYVESGKIHLLSTSFAGVQRVRCMCCWVRLSASFRMFGLLVTSASAMGTCSVETPKLLGCARRFLLLSFENQEAVYDPPRFYMHLKFVYEI